MVVVVGAEVVVVVVFFVSISNGSGYYSQEVYTWAFLGSTL